MERSGPGTLVDRHGRADRTLPVTLIHRRESLSRSVAVGPVQSPRVVADLDGSRTRCKPARHRIAVISAGCLPPSTQLIPSAGPRGCCMALAPSIQDAGHVTQNASKLHKPMEKQVALETLVDVVVGSKSEWRKAQPHNLLFPASPRHLVPARGYCSRFPLTTIRHFLRRCTHVAAKI